jgi:tetraacyldisaccharide 4'-kinase
MSRLEERVAPILSGERRDPAAAVARGGLWLLSALYSGGIAAYRGLFDVGVLRTRHLPARVISVGNLTVGGTGKTPLVSWLARELQAAGERVCILSYGYRAKAVSRVAVVSDGTRRLLTAAEAGDEPAMLADALPGVPVLIGKRRTESGRVAIDRFGASVLLLDDGYQYWRLHRDVNIAVIAAHNPFGYGAMLPRGLLREGPRALRRASAVVITGGAHAEPGLLDTLRRLAPRALVATAVFEPTGLLSPGHERLPAEALQGRKVLAVSGLAQPWRFEETLRRLGAMVRSHRFPDHHAYTRDQVDLLQREAELRDEILVMTAKDSIKVDSCWGGGRLYTLEMALRVVESREPLLRLIREDDARP